MALSSLWISHGVVAMLAHNLFRFALIAVLALLLVRPAAAIEQVSPISVNGWRVASGSGFTETVGVEILPVCREWYGKKYFAVYGVAAPQTHIDNLLVDSQTSTQARCNGTLWDAWATYPFSVPNQCPVAEPPYTYNPATSMCERADICPAAGTLHSDGYFNVGTVPTGALLNSACVSGCKIELISGFVPAARQRIEGVYYYFGSAKYNHTGESCTPDTPTFLSDFVGNLPSATCGAGQQMISMAGVTKCFEAGGAEVNPNSASAVAATVAAGDAAYAAMMDDTAARITAMGGTASDVVAAQTVAAGVFAAGGSPVAAAGGDEVMNAFCADNPTASICVEQDFGTVEDVNLTENIVNVSISPVSVGGAGSCPAPSPFLLRGQTYYFVWDTYCQFASGIKPILLAFGWLAAAGILIGGFRS